MTLKEAKYSIRSLLATYSYQKLIDAYAWNQSGKMCYMDCCGCIRGISTSDVFHTYQECTDSKASGGAAIHYTKANSDLLVCRAEKGFFDLGYDSRKRFECPNALRQRRMSAIIRAAIRLRKTPEINFDGVKEFEFTGGEREIL